VADQQAPTDTRPETPAETHAETSTTTSTSDGATAAELRERLTAAEDHWRRALADLDNLRKRVARDASRQRDADRAQIASEWLPVLDNLDLAVEHSGAGPESIIEGVRVVREQALAVLSRLGFPRRHDEEGTDFDPARHEAVAGVPMPDAKPGTVLRVVRPGYGDDERQLRPASVVVATRGE
jgi:molecular chaperone GrpE